jgi:RNA polymerase sigma-70 factor (ECF subfamily)
LQHLGLPRGSVDDALQDVFLVVHRRLPEFDGRTPLKNWLFGIARRVASEYRRGTRRAIRRLEVVPDLDLHPAGTRELTRVEAAELVRRFLTTLDETKREVFLLAEVEGMTAPEIARALGVKLNTVYGRLRAARLRFEKAVTRHEARTAREEAWTS